MYGAYLKLGYINHHRTGRIAHMLTSAPMSVGRASNEVFLQCLILANELFFYLFHMTLAKMEQNVAYSISNSY